MEKSVCSRASYHILQVLQAHPVMKSVVIREIKTLVFKPAIAGLTAVSATEAKQNSHIRFGDDGEKVSKPKGNGEDRASRRSSKSSMEKLNTHAWYYASVTLNQVVLSVTDQDREVARNMIELYFEMFREILGGIPSSKYEEDAGKVDEVVIDKKSKGKAKAKEVRGEAGFTEVEDESSRLVSAVLVGVNRALPFAKLNMAGDNEVFRKHIDTLFLITHTSTFNISLQALMLILQVVTSASATAPSTSKDGATSLFTTLTDRFYRTLYASLSDQRLGTSNKQAMYLNLVFKALKADTNLERVKAFIRRFIQILVIGVGGSVGIEFITGGLYLLGEVSLCPGIRCAACY
jgi:ribosome biogenesis protein MAK21